MVIAVSTWILVLGLLAGQASAQGAEQQCVPNAPPVAQENSGGGAGQGQASRGGGGGDAGAQRPIPRDTTVTMIPGVVAAGAAWTKVWQQAGNSADGIITDSDGNVLVAQFDFDTVLMIDGSGRTKPFVTNARSVGSLSMDRRGRLFGAHRTERPGSTKPNIELSVNAISILAPASDRKIVATKWADGRTLSVRPNDLIADSQGGAYFTSGCVYYASADGKVTVMADNIRTNGIIFSPDDKTLYVTNGGTVIAFDVMGPGKLTNRRDFATLQSGGGDGLAIDSEGRLYVTTNAGVQVFDKAGKFLGLIPTPRSVISVAFAGAGKKSLFVVGSGAEDANGQPLREGPQQTAATIYRLPMLAEGVKGRAK
jgi:gluconolactonase